MGRIAFTLFFFILQTAWATQVVLITGASRGIGLTTAKTLADAGFIVYAGTRTTSSALFALEREAPAQFHQIQLDVTDVDSIDRTIEKIINEQGCLDILINNAGIMYYGSVENLTIEEAQKMFDVNFFGVMRMTQAVLPIMRKQKSGRIIQISSRSGFRPLPSLSLYAASKFALEGLSEAMAATLQPWNIFISLIEPGPVNTDLNTTSPYGSRLQNTTDPFEPIFRAAGLFDPSPLTQEPEEVAQVILDTIRADPPAFRVQTTKYVENQASMRFVDITGLSNLKEWQKVLQLPRESVY